MTVHCKKKELVPEDFCIIWLSNLLIISIPDEGYSKTRGAY